MSSKEVDLWTGQFDITSNKCSLESAGSPALASMGGLLYLVARQSNDQVAYTTSTDGITWSTAPVVIKDAKAASGVALAAQDRVLHMAYRGAGGDDIFYCTFQNGQWSAPLNLGSQYDCKTSKSPSLAVFGDQLYLVFRGKSSDSLYYSTRPLTGTSAAWTKPASITDANGAQTSEAPAIAAHDNKLFALYRGKDSARIYSCFFDGTLWCGQVAVTEDTRRGPDGPQTSKQVGLAPYKTRLYMAFRGKDSGNLWDSSLGAEEWFSETSITDQNKALTQSGPALALHNDVLVMAFRGNESNNLHGCCLHEAAGH
jgi:hypothetical protein